MSATLTGAEAAGATRAGAGERRATSRGPRRSSARPITAERKILAAIMAVHVALSITARTGATPTAFEDEGLYLFMGHRMIDHALTGAYLTEFPGAYFSGAPALYPVIGALADSLGALAGARTLALVFTCAAIYCVHRLGATLYGTTAGLIGAGAFAVAGSVIFLSAFATFDAPVMALIAACAWWAAASAKREGLLWAVGIGAAMAIAVLTKYAAIAYLPVVCGIAVSVGWQRYGVLIVKRAVLVVAACAGMLFFFLVLWGASLIPGIVVTTTSRNVINPASAAEILTSAARWAGPWLAIAGVGAVIAARRNWLLPAVLLVGAVLAIAQQARIEESTSLAKHVAFGLVFAAPLIGLAGARLIAAWRTKAMLAVVVTIAALAYSGHMYSSQFLAGWVPNTTLVAALKPLAPAISAQRPILGDQPSAERYALRGDIDPKAWNDTYSFSYSGLEGVEAMEEAVDDQYFSVVYLGSGNANGKELRSYVDANPDKYTQVAAPKRYFPGQDKAVGTWSVYVPTRGGMR